MRRAAARAAQLALRGLAADCAAPAAAEANSVQPWRHAATVRRAFSASASQTRGPVSYMSLGLTVGTSVGLLWWYNHEKEKKLEDISREGKSSVVVGQAAIGGPFELVDHRGKRFTEKDLLGQFALMYFGFTWCPDVCPEELEKIAAATDKTEKATGVQVVPVFLSVDPQRDGVEQVRDYVKEFHPRMIGLTGTYEQTGAAAKTYRVYYSKTQDSDDDYLVDHSIITYLINPDGKFVTFYGKNFTADEMAQNISDHVKRWQAEHPQWG
ncbi:SCO1-like protein mitochondrial [Micractinium conductrix]|uniref:SCO1-like protein mitochondrial n=1 Tax=Micractinium conductrix TaxID=554055 RepID=A0A2P6VDU3_9CHLO|nr:SCO1-like protein mitochondrial [Micractinium conductrix]|eukprot:PSC72247.1 SCO1-like protein mitochondrial [Micractinium conductrix]